MADIGEWISKFRCGPSDAEESPDRFDETNSDKADELLQCDVGKDSSEDSASSDCAPRKRRRLKKASVFWFVLIVRSSF